MKSCRVEEGQDEQDDQEKEKEKEECCVIVRDRKGRQRQSNDKVKNDEDKCNRIEEKDIKGS